MRRRFIPPLLVAGIILIPAIGASAQLPPVTTTTVTVPITTTTTTAATTTTTTAATTTTTTEATTTTTASTTTTTEATTTTTASTTTSTTTTTSSTTTTTTPHQQQSGSLSISAPTASTLTPAESQVFAGAGNIIAQLGAVTVTDARGAINSSWTATVAASTFTTGGAAAAETILRPNIAYWSGPAIAIIGIGAFTPGQPGEDDQQDLTVSRTAFRGAGAVGNTEVTWNPTIHITIPASAVAGVYTGTITHSVA